MFRQRARLHGGVAARGRRRPGSAARHRQAGHGDPAGGGQVRRQRLAQGRSEEEELAGEREIAATIFDCLQPIIDVDTTLDAM